MKVNARTEEFQHIEVFDKPALFTNGRIARDTVPKGWYCYDIRGSDDDPGELCYMEENVVVNHAGSVLMPEKLAMPKTGRLDVRDELGFLDEGNMTLREFCEAHQLSYPAENMKFHIRPARPEEAGLFYTPHPEEDTVKDMCRVASLSVTLGLFAGLAVADIPHTLYNAVSIFLARISLAVGGERQPGATMPAKDIPGQQGLTTGIQRYTPFLFGGVGAGGTNVLCGLKQLLRYDLQMGQRL